MKLRIKLPGIPGEREVNWFNGWLVGEIADALVQAHHLQKDGFTGFLYRSNGEVLQRTFPLNQMGHPDGELLELRMVRMQIGTGAGSRI